MPAIEDGQQASAAAFLEALEAVRTTGQSVLDDLGSARVEALFRLQQGLNSLNAKRQRAVRVLSPDIACRFVVSDMLDIDQAATSGTVRADAQAATLRERSESAQAEVRQTTFSSSVGTIEEFNGMYRVHVTDDSRPTGVFEVELSEPSVVTVLVFDTLTLPSSPVIQVSGSADGVVLAPAAAVSRNGYRVNAWFPAAAVKYLRIEITPNMPDTLGGSTYTFGLTSLTASTVDYRLYSEVVTKPVLFHPVTAQVRFKANESDLAYFLQFGTDPVIQVAPDQVVSLAGVEQVTVDTQINPAWRLAAGPTPCQLPDDVYPSSLKILDVAENRAVKLAYGLDVARIGPGLVQEYVAVSPYQSSGWMDLVPVNTAQYVDQSGRTFRVTYTHGPQDLTARLFVRLSTRDRHRTPVFRGAWFESVY